MGEYGNTKVIQITNIAPQATRDQMHSLFGNIGKIEDLRLYPSIRDATVQIKNRCCFLKFIEMSTLPLALHMTNTVFIDRAIVVQPFVNGDLPDEWSGLEFANSAQNKGEPTLPSFVSNVEEDGVLKTVDPNLEDSGLPLFPPLPVGTDEKVVEEIRRTITVIDIDPALSAQSVIEYIGKSAGEVKYFRWCTKENDDRKMALVELTDYGAIIPAMRLNDTVLGEKTIKVYYATKSICKPQKKSNEAAQKEIEEAMKKVKEAQSLVSDAVNPLKEWLGVKGGGRITRSRSRTPVRDYYRGIRSRSRDRRRRSRDRYSSRRRSRSRSRRRRSRSRSRRRSRSKKRSRSRKKSRSRSKDKKVKKEKSKSKVKEEPDMKKEGEENGTDVKKESEANGNVKSERKSRSRSRSKSRDKKRSRSRDRRRSRSRSKKRRSRSRSKKRSSRRSRSRDRRSRSRDRKKRSRSRRRSRSRSKDKKSRRSRSKSRDHKSKKSKKSKRGSEERDTKDKKISRDYDAEEKGYENGKDEKGPVDMEISNSP